MTFNAVVMTAGRTGSHLICDNLSKHFEVPVSHWDQKLQEGIIHCHDPSFNPPFDNTVCVISVRRNIFEAILSVEIASRVGEWTVYTNKFVEPFMFSEQQFLRRYIGQKCFERSIRTENYNRVITIYYEQMLADPYYLFRQFDIDKTTDYTRTKSPYRYENLILNYQDLQKAFESYDESKIITDQVLTKYQNTTTEMLKKYRNFSISNV